MPSGPTASTIELVDSNIFDYAVDSAAGPKHSIARDLVNDLRIRRALAVSVQVLNEFYWVSTRPHKSPALPHARALQAVNDLLAVSVVFPLTPSITLLALDIIPRHSLSFWDALIWAAAKENGVAAIHTEDSQDGRVVEGVLYHNPFAATP